MGPVFRRPRHVIRPIEAESRTLEHWKSSGATPASTVVKLIGGARRLTIIDPAIHLS
jgi:hypothetical protein